MPLHCTPTQKESGLPGPPPPSAPPSVHCDELWLFCAIRDPLPHFVATARELRARMHPQGVATGSADCCGRPQRNKQRLRALLAEVHRLKLRLAGSAEPGRGHRDDRHRCRLLGGESRSFKQIDPADGSTSCERHESRRHACQLESAPWLFECTHRVCSWDAGLAGCASRDGTFPPDALQMRAMRRHRRLLVGVTGGECGALPWACSA